MEDKFGLTREENGKKLLKGSLTVTDNKNPPKQTLHQTYRSMGCVHFGSFFYPPSFGIAPCVGTAGKVQTPTLDAALFSSSRAGADLGRKSDSRV